MNNDSPEMFRLLASAPAKGGKGGAAALAISALVHLTIAAILVWATMAVGEELAGEEEVTLIELAEDIIPPPPPPPPEPAPPPPEGPKGFQTLSTPTFVPPDIPPPGEAISEEDFSGEGVEGGRGEGEVAGPEGEVSNVFAFTPYTVKPKCKAGCEPEEILRHLPGLLKKSGVSCDLTVGIRIDTEGNVTATDMLKPSGNPGCDQAALEWARTTQWTTAYNRDQAVTVWIAQPVKITTE